MLVLAIDNFLLVFSTLAYPEHHAKVVKLYSFAAWVVLIISIVPGLPGLMNCYTVSVVRSSCFFNASCLFSCSILGYFLILVTVLAYSSCVPSSFTFRVIDQALLFSRWKEQSKA